MQRKQRSPGAMEKQQVPSKALVLFASCLLSLLLSDVLVRVFFPVPSAGYGAWSAQPGSSIEMISRPDGQSAVHRYNNFGFRGGEIRVAPTTELRIAAVGDSFTEGVGVKEEETWPTALSGLLENQYDVEVLNLGDSGAPLTRYAEIVAKVAIPLKADHIVVCIIPSDLRFGRALPQDRKVPSALSDPFREERVWWQQPFVRLLPGWTYLVDRALGKWPIQRGRSWIEYERLLQLTVERVTYLERIPRDQARLVVEERLSELESEVVEAARLGEFNPSILRYTLSGESWSSRVTLVEAEREKISDEIRSWLSWFASTARQHGAEPWILYYPEAALVARGPWGLFLDLEKPDVLGDTSVRDLLRDHCKDLDISFIDATAVLVSGPDRELYLRYDTHPTATAHELVALEVARSMRPALESRKPVPH